MDPTGVANCCTGNGTRTIFYAWQRMLDYKNNELRVHLLLNRASAWADVQSYIPYQGRLDLKIKKPCDSVLVRVPEWIEDRSPTVSCQQNGKPLPVVWSGRYISAGAAKAGDVLAFSFPISERQVKERIGGVDYVLRIRGNTVVEVSPPGKLSPRYQRADYRTSEVRWKRAQRFVSSERIDW